MMFSKHQFLTAAVASVAVLSSAAAVQAQSFTPTQTQLESLVNAAFGPQGTTTSVTPGPGGVGVTVTGNLTDDASNFTRFVAQRPSSGANPPIDLSGFSTFDVNFQAPLGSDVIGVQAFIQTGPGFTFRQSGDVTLVAGGPVATLSFPIGAFADRNDTRQFGFQFFGPDGTTSTGNQVFVTPVGAVVPEPASLGLLGLGGLALTARRRRA